MEANEAGKTTLLVTNGNVPDGITEDTRATGKKSTESDGESLLNDPAGQ